MRKRSENCRKRLEISRFRLGRSITTLPEHMGVRSWAHHGSNITVEQGGTFQQVRSLTGAVHVSCCAKLRDRGTTAQESLRSCDGSRGMSDPYVAWRGGENFSIFFDFFLAIGSRSIRVGGIGRLSLRSARRASRRLRAVKQARTQVEMHPQRAPVARQPGLRRGR